MDRRRFLRSGLGGVAAVGLPPLTLAACGGSSANPLAATALGDDIALLSGAGGNIVAFSSSSGVVLVDTGAPEDADGLKASLRELFGRAPVSTAFNTHYHLDQTGGNESLSGDGAQIVAHERVRVRLMIDQWSYSELRYEPARPEAAWPTETIRSSGEITPGGTQVDYGYLLHAHTDGDIYVFFRDANVLAVGDVASPVRDPVFDWFAGGWLGGRIDSMAQLLELADENTRIVPAYGPVMSRADLEAEHAMITEIYSRVHELFRQGRSAADMLAEGALDGLDRSFEDPARLLYDIHKSLWAHQSSMSHDIV